MSAQDRSRRTWRFGEGDAITDELTALRLLGGGASYEAYLAFDDVTLCPVVVKVVRPDQVEDPGAVRALAREVRALATLTHPVVVRGLRHQLVGPRPHVVLEAVDGPRLSSLLRRHGPLQDYQYLALGVDVAAALHYLRRLGWTHLDVKPSNVIMGAPARLIDLSVAREVDAAAALETAVGTDAYMAPEQCDPPRTGRPGPASDVWGLGATLFEAIAGHRAHEDGDPRAADPAVRCPQLVSAPSALPAGTDRRVVDLLAAMLDPEPAARPEPHEVAEALQPVLADLPRRRLAGYRVR